MADEQMIERLGLIADGADPDPLFAARLGSLLEARLGFAGSTTAAAQAGPVVAGRVSPTLLPTATARHPSRMLRLLLVAAFVALTVAAIVIGAALLQRSSLSYTPHLEATTCPRFTAVSVTCDMLVVPVDRAHPDGGQTKLMVASATTTSTHPGLPFVFTESSTASDSQQANTLTGNPALDRADMIWVGHRGSIASGTSLACPEVDAASIVRLALPLADPTTAAAWSSAVRACRDRLVGQGIDLGAFDTAAVAADIADARIALDIADWDVQTFTGSRIIETLLRDRPEGVHSVVLDSPIALDADRFGSALPDLVASLAALQRACDADPPCGTQHPDIPGDLTRQAAAYQAAPSVVSVLDPALDQVDVLLDGARRWEIARAELAEQGSLGDLPAEFAQPRSADLDTALATLASRIAYPQTGDAYGAYLSQVCPDEFAFADQGAIAAASAGSPADGPYLPPPAELAACDAWGLSASDPSTRRQPRSDVPALILSGAIDPLVPPASAVEVATSMPNADLVTGDQATDHQFWTTRLVCARAIRAAFLDDPTQAPDRSCVDKPITFK